MKFRTEKYLDMAVDIKLQQKGQIKKKKIIKNRKMFFLLAQNSEWSIQNKFARD